MSLIPVYAQFTDGFGDGDFTHNPTWVGKDSLFKIEGEELWLNGPKQSDTAYLVTECKVSLDASWTGSVHFDFNPSSSNCCRIYLMSDNLDLQSALDGYFLQIGGSKDEICLYRQEGAMITQLIDGQDNRISSDPVDLRFKVTRNENHEWEVLTDSTGGQNFVSEGRAIDSAILKSSYFGIFCKYTSTRADKFSFDEFSVSGTVFRDTHPPYVIGSGFIGDDRWSLEFNEPVDGQSVVTADIEFSSYGMVQKASGIEINGPELICTFEKSFPHGKFLHLKLPHVADTAGNISNDISVTSLFNDARKFKPLDIRLNEIMPDPSPTLGLPEFEYIELYNRSQDIIDLKGFRIADTRDTFILKNGRLYPGAYFLLVADEDTGTFFVPDSSVLAGIPNLNNDQDDLILLSPIANVIDSIRYFGDWLKGSEGGLSLELVNPEYLCNNSRNWKSSLNLDGGTPGKQNSVYTDKRNIPIPEIENLHQIDTTQLVFELNISPTIEANLPEGVFIPSIEYDKIITSDSLLTIVLNELPDYNTLYTFELKDFPDCYGDFSDVKFSPVVFPQSAKPGDIVINEILFNPYTGGSDFIELYNGSSKLLNLHNWKVVNQLGDTSMISDTYREFKASSFCGFSEDTGNIAFNYPLARMGVFLEIDLPSFNDKSGSVVLLNPENNVIDQFDYSDNMHFPLIDDVEGVSLERRSYTTATNNHSNWTSASSNVGYATPGYRNSQSVNDVDGQKEFYASPGIFSPDNDGYFDLVDFHFRLKQPGSVGSISIYDRNGLLIKSLISNELLNDHGQFSWDGTDDHNELVSMGYYLALFEYFNLDGQINRYMATVVLAHKMK